jgi:predicted nucleic acid-binding protein
VLTDTTFWIDLLDERRAGQRGPAHQFLVAHRAQSLRVSIVTWGELAEGVLSSADLEAVLYQVRLLFLPRQVAWEASRIQREVTQRLGENDAWIAATARVWGLRLVSRDGAFRRVPRLQLVGY